MQEMDKKANPTQVGNSESWVGILREKRFLAGEAKRKVCSKPYNRFLF